MVVSFSGDPFLAVRAARRELRNLGLGADEVVELGEGMDAASVARSAGQGGLFGRVGLLLDLDAAFSGKQGVRPRNEVIEALGSVPQDALVVVIDLAATPARQKRYLELGEHRHLPTPRFGALQSWVQRELREAGLEFDREVPSVLTDLFGEDLPALASEITKLAALGERLSGERVRQIAGRSPARDAFDLIEAVAAGDGAVALDVCESLTSQGEAAPRVLAALIWQFGLVARCVALREARGRLSEAEASQALSVKPYSARKALAIASRLDEESLRRALAAILRADRAMKSGRDERWTLEALALDLAGLFAPAASR